MPTLVTNVLQAFRQGVRPAIETTRRFRLHIAPMAVFILVSAAFVRGYDMSDPAIEVLRRDDVADHHHVELQSVNFRINLPAMVSPHNPVPGTNRVAREILS